MTGPKRMRAEIFFNDALKCDLNVMKTIAKQNIPLLGFLLT